MEISKRMKELRMKAGLSVGELAQKAEVPASSYQEWEQGRRILDPRVYFRLAEILGVSAEFLVLGTEESIHESDLLKDFDQILDDLKKIRKKLTLVKRQREQGSK